MADIDLDELTYRKNVIDQKDTDIKNILDNKIISKLDISEVGGPDGVLRLESGKVPSINIPFATSIESSNGTLLNVAMSPGMVRQEINSAKNLFVPIDSKAIPNGVASLNSLAKIPVNQIPPLNYVESSEKNSSNGVCGLDSNGKTNLSNITSSIAQLSTASMPVSLPNDLVNYTDVKNYLYDTTISSSVNKVNGSISPSNSGVYKFNINLYIEFDSVTVTSKSPFFIEIFDTTSQTTLYEGMVLMYDKHDELIFNISAFATLISGNNYLVRVKSSVALSNLVFNNSIFYIELIETI